MEIKEACTQFCGSDLGAMIGTQKINIKRKDINFLLAQNNVTGCSSAINRALADILKKPEGIPVHDWWIAVTASLFGDIKYISFLLSKSDHLMMF